MAHHVPIVLHAQLMLVPNAKRKDVAVGGTVTLTLPGCPLYLDLALCPPLPLAERLVHYIVGAVKGTPVLGNDGLSTLCLWPSLERLYPLGSEK